MQSIQNTKCSPNPNVQNKTPLRQMHLLCSIFTKYPVILYQCISSVLCVSAKFIFIRLLLIVYEWVKNKYSSKTVQRYGNIQPFSLQPKLQAFKKLFVYEAHICSGNGPGGCTERIRKNQLANTPVKPEFLNCRTLTSKVGG